MLLTVQGHELAHGHVRVGMESNCLLETALYIVQQKQTVSFLVLGVGLFRLVHNRPSLRPSGKTPTWQAPLEVIPAPA